MATREKRMKKVAKKFQLIISFDDKNDVSEISPAAMNKRKMRKLQHGRKK